MRIDSFEATKVHGHLKLKVKFFKGLSFLTGINGSGKTTVLRGIVALTRPALSTLVNTNFERMSVRGQNANRRFVITATRERGGVKVSVNSFKETLFIPNYIPDEDEPSFRQDEQEAEFYEQVEVGFQKSRVFKYLKALPNPMFLGLERRGGQGVSRRVPGRRRPRRGRSVFSSSILQSISEAASLAEQDFREAQGANVELTDALRKDIILTALEIYHDSPQYKFSAKLDSDAIGKKEATLKSTLKQLGLDMAEVERRVDPYFAQIRKVADFTKQRSQRQLLEGSATNRRELVDFLVSRRSFRTIEHVLTLLDVYIAKREQVFEKVNFYLRTLNRFFVDSKKSIKFNDAGYLEVELSNGETRDVSELSSGESQIFVIATHLMFNPLAKASNVLIIDEPEISLHLRWQDLFVSTVQEINSGLQLILATHSPAIVGKNKRHCVDLG